MNPRGGSFPSLTELALALPSQIARALIRFFVATRPGGNRIKTPPMSGAWLTQYEVAYGKHGDAL